MTLFATLTVLGVLVLRFTQPKLERPYKTFGYPLTPLFFIAANLWFMYFWMTSHLMPSLIGIGVVAVGLVVYFAANHFSVPLVKEHVKHAKVEEVKHSNTHKHKK